MKASLKNRIISAALALAMVLPLWPAGLFVPAHALENETSGFGVSHGDLTLRVDKDGNYTVTLATSLTMSNAQYVLAILPDFSKTANTTLLDETEESNGTIKATTDIDTVRNLSTRINSALPNVPYMITEGTITASSGDTFTFSGTFGGTPTASGGGSVTVSNNKTTVGTGISTIKGTYANQTLYAPGGASHSFSAGEEYPYIVYFKSSVGGIQWTTADMVGDIPKLVFEPGSITVTAPEGEIDLNETFKSKEIKIVNKGNAPAKITLHWHELTYGGDNIDEFYFVNGSLFTASDELISPWKSYNNGELVENKEFPLDGEEWNDDSSIIVNPGEENAVKVCVQFLNPESGQIGEDQLYGGEDEVSGKITLEYFKADPEEGYAKVDGTRATTDFSYTFKRDSDASIDVTFVYGNGTPDYVVTGLTSGGDITSGKESDETTSGSWPNPDPTRTGYTFKGWFNTSASTGGTQYTSMSTFTASTTLYARWEKDTVDYTITVAENNSGYGTASISVAAADGSVLGKVATVIENKTATISATPNTGYEFVNWTNSEDGTTITSASTTVTSTKDITYTANFQPITITFNPNGSGATVSPTTATASTTDGKVSMPTPTRSGYTFDGWYTLATGGSQEDNTTVHTASHTLYAHWTENGAVTVNIYKDNTSTRYDPTGAPAYQISKQSASPAEVYTLNKDSIGKYTYSGTPSDGKYDVIFTISGTATTIGTVNVSSKAGSTDIMYYTVSVAVKDQNNTANTGGSASLTYGGTSGTSEVVLEGTALSGFTFAATPDSSNGYRFKEWQGPTTIDGSGNTTGTVNATTTYTAVFQKTYTVGIEADPVPVSGSKEYEAILSYTPAGGSYTSIKVDKSNPTRSPVTVDANSTVALTHNNDSTNGYHLKNWTLKDESTAIEDFSGIQITSDRVFVAHFEPNTATVKITKDGNKFDGLTVKLQGPDASTGTVDLTETPANSGVYTCSGPVVKGTYKILIGGADSGQTITITDAVTAAPTGSGTVGTNYVILPYYEVKYAAAATLEHAQADGPVPAGTLTTAPAISASVPSGTSTLRGTTASNIATAVSDGDYVISGTEVTFHTATWGNAEYELSWDVAAADGAQTDSGLGANAKLTYSEARAEVTSKLTQKTYDVTATFVTSDASAVKLTDKDRGGLVYTFGDSSPVTKQLPKGTYSISQTIADGSTLDGYNYSSTKRTTTSGTPEKKTTDTDYNIISVTGDTGFAIVTHGDRYEWSVKDSGVGSTTQDQAITYENGIYGWVSSFTPSASSKPATEIVTLKNESDKAVIFTVTLGGDTAAYTTTFTGFTGSGPYTITVAAGASAAFTLVPNIGTDGRSQAAGAHNATYTVTATKQDGTTPVSPNNTTTMNVVYNAHMTVNQATITAATAGDGSPYVHIPVVGTLHPDSSTDLDLSASANNSFSGSDVLSAVTAKVAWSDGAGPTASAVAGGAYTAKVVLTAKDKNYVFGDTNTYQAYYKMNVEQSGSGSADVAADQPQLTATVGTNSDGVSTLTLVYQFPPVEVTGYTVSLEPKFKDNTNQEFNTMRASVSGLTPGTGVTAKVYYAIIKTSDIAGLTGWSSMTDAQKASAITASVLAGASGGSGQLPSGGWKFATGTDGDKGYETVFEGLTSDTAYTVFTAVRLFLDGKEGSTWAQTDATQPKNSESVKTWHKVTVEVHSGDPGQVSGTNNNPTPNRTYSAAPSFVTALPDNGVLSIKAEPSNNTTAFANWDKPADDEGTIGTSSSTVDLETDDTTFKIGTAAEVTITANFKNSSYDFSIKDEAPAAPNGDATVTFYDTYGNSDPTQIKESTNTRDIETVTVTNEGTMDIILKIEVGSDDSGGKAFKNDQAATGALYFVVKNQGTGTGASVANANGDIVRLKPRGTAEFVVRPKTGNAVNDPDWTTVYKITAYKPTAVSTEAAADEDAKTAYGAQVGEPKTYTANLVVKAKELDGANIAAIVAPVATKVPNPKESTPADIKAAYDASNAPTGTTDPNYDAKYDSNATAYQYSVTGVTWTPTPNGGTGNNEFVGGTVYTVTVELTANGNYTFPDVTNSNYTINTLGQAAPNVTVTKKNDGTSNDLNNPGNKITLTYTFPATAPTVSVALEGTDWYKADATATVTAPNNAKVKVYYALIEKKALSAGGYAAPSAAQIKGHTAADPTGYTWKYLGTSGTQTVSGTTVSDTVVFGTPTDSLKPFTEYVVFATAAVVNTVDDADVEGALSDVAKNDDYSDVRDWTYHKLIVTEAPGAPAVVQTPSGSPIGVKHGDTAEIDIQALVLNFKEWEIYLNDSSTKSWTSPAKDAAQDSYTGIGGTFKDYTKSESTDTTVSAKYTAPGDADYNSSAKTIKIQITSKNTAGIYISGITLVSGALANTSYYAITSTDDNTRTDPNHDVLRKNDVYGHRDAADATRRSARLDRTISGDGKVRFQIEKSDGTTVDAILGEGTEGVKADLVYGEDTSVVKELPAAGYVFSNNGKNDQEEFDGKRVYLRYRYVDASGVTHTLYAGKPLGTLTVRALKATEIIPSALWTPAQLTFTVDDTFSNVAGTTANVRFLWDTGETRLARTEEGFTYADYTAPAGGDLNSNGSNNFFYMYGTLASVPTAEIKTGDALNNGHDGKILYVCYRDVNDNLVYAPVGMLTVKTTEVLPKAIEIFTGLNTMYYAWTGTDAVPIHAKSNRTSVTGDDGKTLFTFDHEHYVVGDDSKLVTGKIVYSDGTTRVLNPGTGTSDTSTLYYGSGWRLVYGDTSAAAKGHFLDNGADNYEGVTFHDTDTGAAAVSSTTNDSKKYDGKNIYIQIGETVIDAPVGVLTVQQLWAQDIVPVGAMTKLSYEVGDSLNLAGITRAYIKFNEGAMDGKYTATQMGTTKGTQYYYKIDGNVVPAGFAFTDTSYDGKILELCYTDVNGHEVKVPVGKLTVGSDGSNAVVRIENQTHNNGNTQYGDKLKAIASGTRDGATVTYQWQYLDSTTWKNVTTTDGTSDTYTAGKEVANHYVRVVLTETKDSWSGTAESTTATTLTDKDANAPGYVYVDKKDIYAVWTWVPGSREYDGTSNADVGASGANYTYTGLNGANYADQAVSGDNITLKQPTSGAFADANAAPNKAITLTGVAFADSGMGTYYNLIQTAPKGTITALQLKWSDFKFDVATTKRYDGKTTVYATENTSLRNENTNPIPDGQQIGGATIDGKKPIDWGTTADTLTTAAKDAIKAALTADFAYTSKNAAGDNNSAIKVTLHASDSNFALPSGTWYIENCTINPKEVDVNNDDLNSSERTPSTTVGVPDVTIHGDVDHNRVTDPKRLVDGDSSFGFTVVGSFANVTTADTGVTVTINPDSVQSNDSNYKLKWTGGSTTGTVTEANIDHVMSYGNAKGIYQNAYSTLEDLEVEVAFDAAETKTRVLRSIKEITDLGLTVRITGAEGSAGDSGITEADLIPWDTGTTATSATLTYSIYKDNVQQTAKENNVPGASSATITVAQRPVRIDSAVWSVQDLSGSYTGGKYYDGTTRAISDGNTGTTNDQLWPAGNTANPKVEASVTITPKAGDIKNDEVTLMTDTAVLDDPNVSNYHTISITGKLISNQPKMLLRYKVDGGYDLINQHIAPRPVKVELTSPSVLQYSDKNVTVSGELKDLDGGALPNSEKVTVAVPGVYDQTDTVVTATNTGPDSAPGAPTGHNNVTVTQVAISNPNYVVETSGWPAGNTIDGSVTAHRTKNIQHVTLSLTPPTTGAAASGAASAATATYTDTGEYVAPGTSLISAAPVVEWKGDNDGDGTYNDSVSNFQPGVSYRATIKNVAAKTAGSYTFATSPVVDFTVNGSVAVAGGTTVSSGLPSGIKSIQAVKNGDHDYNIVVTFEKQGSQNVTDVVVLTNLYPEFKATIPTVTVAEGQPYRAAAGGKMEWQYSPTESGTYNRVDHTEFKAGFYKVIGQVEMKHDGTDDVAWSTNYDITTASRFYLGSLGEVQIDRTWTGEHPVTKGGQTVAWATFAANKGPAPTTTAADMNGDAYADSTVYTLTLRFPEVKDTTDPTIVKVAANVVQPVSNVDRPIGNNNLTAILARNKDEDDMLSHVTMTFDKWQVGDAFGGPYSTATGTKFEDGKYYRAIFTVETQDGYKFLEKTTSPADYVDFLVNSVGWLDGAKSGTKNDIKVTTTKTTAEKKYTVMVDFPKTGSTIDVLTVWGNVKQPEAGKVAGTATIEVAPSEPYRIDSAGGKWYTDAACTSEFNGTFVAGTTYYAKMTVELKDANHQFNGTASPKTEGYINDTAGNGTDPATGTKVTYITGSGSDEHPQEISLVRAFTVDKKAINVVVNSPVPSEGGVAPTSPNVSANGTGYREKSGGKLGWFKDENGTTPMGGTDTFVNGTTYYLFATVEPTGSEYELPGTSETNRYTWNQGMMNAKKVTGNATDGYTAVFAYKVGGATAGTKQIHVPIPKKGDAVSGKKGSSPDNSVDINTTMTGTNGGTKWVTSGGAGGTGVTGTFADNTTYTAIVYVDGVSTTDEVYVNGEKQNPKDDGNGHMYVTYTYTIPKETTTTTIIGGGGGGGGGGTVTVTKEPPIVYYKLRDMGTTNDLTAEKIETEGSRPKKVPTVTPLEGLKFLGWSETEPVDGVTPTLVDPSKFAIFADKVFYAVYDKTTVVKPEEFDHNHYVIGFPDGTFGPEAYITRGQVATIVARACLIGFEDSGNYGNPGRYTDISDHWAYSAISFCALHSVMSGYHEDDGTVTFRPEQYISRQELANVVARLVGVKSNQGMPFTDVAGTYPWALDSIYTVYSNGWMRGYLEDDGTYTFRPSNYITRAETVTVFNSFLRRGVDAEGLSTLRAYTHTGVASHNTGNGYDEYMIWPDVVGHWAYYEILEAGNDHNFHWQNETAQVPPEKWDQAYIDKKWRYTDDINDGANNVGHGAMQAVTFVVKFNGRIVDSVVRLVPEGTAPMSAVVPGVAVNSGWRFVGWSITDPDIVGVNLVNPTSVVISGPEYFYAIFELAPVESQPAESLQPAESAQPTGSPAPVESAQPTGSPAPTESAQPTGSPAPTESAQPTASPAPTESAQPSPTPTPTAPVQVNVTYVIKSEGRVVDSVSNQVAQGSAPAEDSVPDARANEGWKFLGWSMTDPDEGNYQLVEPSAVTVNEDVTFYAVFEKESRPETPKNPRRAYISGFEDGTFRPDAPLNRSAVAKLLADLKGGYDPNQTYDASIFTDLNDHWARNVIGYCVQEGLMGGYLEDDGTWTFRADNGITRQELACAMCKLTGETLQNRGLPFADAADVAEWALDGVYTAYSKGWMTGYEDGLFHPEMVITRAAAVKLLNNYLGRQADPDAIRSSTGYTTWSDVPATHWAYYEIIEASNDWDL